MHAFGYRTIKLFLDMGRVNDCKRSGQPCMVCAPQDACCRCVVKSVTKKSSLQMKTCLLWRKLSISKTIEFIQSQGSLQTGARD